MKERTFVTSRLCGCGGKRIELLTADSQIISDAIHVGRAAHNGRDAAS